MTPTTEPRESLEAGYPTTRRYARSLQQAFPSDYAHAVEIYRKPSVIGCIRALVLMAFQKDKK